MSFRAAGSKVFMEGYMAERRITRKEFLKIAGFGIFTIFVLPGMKRLNVFRKAHKEAKYYKKLAG